MFLHINNTMAILLKTASVRVSSIHIMQVRVQNKGKGVWKSRYDGHISATAARRREAEVEARTCVSDLARYTELLREEEERLVEHANHRFERGRLERQRAFEVSVAEAERQAPHCGCPARR